MLQSPWYELMSACCGQCCVHIGFNTPQRVTLHNNNRCNSPTKIINTTRHPQKRIPLRDFPQAIPQY